MNAFFSKRTSQSSTDHNSSPDLGKRMLTSKCMVKGALGIAATLLIVFFVLTMGRIDRVHAELDALQAFEAARSETVVKLFDFGSLLQSASDVKAVPDRRAILSAYADYLVSLMNLNQYRLFEEQETRLARIRDLSAEYQSKLDFAMTANNGTESGKLIADLDIDPIVVAFTELGVYNSSLIADQTLRKADIYRMNTLLIGMATALILIIAGSMLFCLRKRYAAITQEKQTLLVSNQTLNANLSRVETLFNVSLGVSSVTMFMQNRDLVYSWVHGTIADCLSSSDVGHSDYHLPNWSHKQIFIAAKLDVMKTGNSTSFECNRDENGKKAYYWVNIDPLIQDGMIIGIVGVIKNVTDRRRREEETQVLLQELVHRAQNLLGVVLSMAKLSARSAESVDVFSERFSERIASMARSFEVLVDHDWQGAPIRQLLEARLADLDLKLQGRFTLSGDDFQLNPLLAQNVALAFHELVSNAIDHGALSDGNGRVAISWKIRTCDDGSPEFHFSWAELSVDPKILHPDLVGFGRTVLETIVPRALNGVATLSNGPQGIIWTLSCPFEAHSDSSSLSAPMTSALSVLEKPQFQNRLPMTDKSIAQVH